MTPVMRTASDQPDPRRRLGALGESLAAHHLEARGFKILDRNFRTRRGELDLVAHDGHHLVFCEVKTRVFAGEPGPFGPLVAIGPDKRRRLRAMAREWLVERSGAAAPAAELRFDAIGISLDRSGQLQALDHLEGAF
jgi:putative endonuclease